MHLGATIENELAKHQHKDAKIESIRRQQALEDILGLSSRAKQQKAARAEGVPQFRTPKATIVV